MKRGGCSTHSIRGLRHTGGSTPSAVVLCCSAPPPSPARAAPQPQARWLLLPAAAAAHLPIAWPTQPRRRVCGCCVAWRQPPRNYAAEAGLCSQRLSCVRAALLRGGVRLPAARPRTGWRAGVERDVEGEAGGEGRSGCRWCVDEIGVEIGWPRSLTRTCTADKSVRRRAAGQSFASLAPGSTLQRSLLSPRCSRGDDTTFPLHNSQHAVRQPQRSPVVPQQQPTCAQRAAAPAAPQQQP